MKFGHKLATSVVMSFFAIAIAINYFQPSAVNATPAYATATSSGCGACHVAGVTASRSSVNGFGQRYAQCGYQLNCARSPQPPQVVQRQNPYSPPPGNYVPPNASAGFQPGKIWLVQLRESTGKSADVIWKFRPNTNVVDATMYIDGKHLDDILTYEGYRNGAVSFFSAKLQMRYTGIPSADTNHIFNGTVAGANFGQGDSWTASIWED
ncbi:hypothetical protein [Sphingorhabdus sp. M41]|uniref:hypothetical protein n=1 Tax=Sphingorhabdus sp. M41 TaxID=1806885 RepID=UPI0012E860C1|nr:hypothetical protein [Sphingorhabdus sp. M41]